MKRWFLLLTIILLGAGAKITHSEREWLEILGKERFLVMRKKGTEHAHLGKYTHTQGDGIYACAACSLPLFEGTEKYDAGNGFPSFKKPMSSKNIYYLEDWSFSFQRYEVLCRGCDSHLGHVFHDGPPPKHFRYCINSIALVYTQRDAKFLGRQK